jgi:hypothetical protein
MFPPPLTHSGLFRVNDGRSRDCPLHAGFYRTQTGLPKLLEIQSYLYNPYTSRCIKTRYGLFFTVNRIIRSFNKNYQKDTKNTD